MSTIKLIQTKDKKNNSLIPEELITGIKSSFENPLTDDVISRIYRDRSVKSNLRSFRRKRTEHMRANVTGHIYEAYCYILILSWAKNHPKVSNFVLKGSNISKIPNKLKIPHGFTYNKDKQIIYASDGYSYGEFDVIFMWDKTPVFIEIKKGIGNKVDAFRKINLREKLCRKIFQTNNAICLLINPDLNISSKINDLPYLKSISIAIPKEITNKLLRKGYKDSKNKLKPISGNSTIILPFTDVKNIPYKGIESKLLGDIRKTLENDMTMKQFFELNREYLGIIHRLLLGEIKSDEYLKFITFIETHYNQSISVKLITKIVIGLDLHPAKKITPFILIIKGKKDKIYQYKLKTDPTRKTLTRLSPLFKELGDYTRNKKLTFEYFELFYKKRNQFLIPTWRNI